MKPSASLSSLIRLSHGFVRETSLERPTHEFAKESCVAPLRKKAFPVGSSNKGIFVNRGEFEQRMVS